MEGVSTKELLSRIEELEMRLAESEQVIEAIKAGEVDAFAVSSNERSEIYTLQSGDYAYRVLIEEFGDGALNVTEDGLVVYSNAFFYELLELSYEHVIGLSIFEFIHEDSMEQFKALFSQALTGRSKGEINLYVADKIIPVYLSLSSLQPTLATIGMIITDLTDKKNNEAMIIEYHRNLEIANNKLLNQNQQLLNINEELAGARNFINSVLESTNHGVLSYIAVRENDQVVDFEIHYANEKALEQVNLPMEEVIGKRYLTIMPMAKRFGLFDRVIEVLETKKSRTYEVQSPNYPYHWFMTRYAPLGDGVTATFFDITDQKNQAKILEEKNRELERSNTELASFTYIASHDLQEPLRKIQTFTKRILEKEAEHFNEQISDYFARIITATKKNAEFDPCPVELFTYKYC